MKYCSQMSRRKMHIFTVFSLLAYLEELFKKKGGKILREDFQKLAADALAICLLHIHSKDEEIPDKKQMIWAVKSSLMSCLSSDRQLLLLTWATLNDSGTLTLIFV